MGRKSALVLFILIFLWTFTQVFPFFFLRVTFAPPLTGEQFQTFLLETGLTKEKEKVYLPEGKITPSDPASLDEVTGKEGEIGECVLPFRAHVFGALDHAAVKDWSFFVSLGPPYPQGDS